MNTTEIVTVLVDDVSEPRVSDIVYLPLGAGQTYRGKPGIGATPTAKHITAAPGYVPESKQLNPVASTLRPLQTATQSTRHERQRTAHGCAELGTYLKQAGMPLRLVPLTPDAVVVPIVG